MLQSMGEVFTLVQAGIFVVSDTLLLHFLYQNKQFSQLFLVVGGEQLIANYDAALAVAFDD
jgi:hypothetical protein